MRLRRRAIVPLSLGLGMLGVVVAAGLTPNTGVVRAASNCTYGNCVAAQPFPLWAVAASVAVVVVALLLALLLLRRRRRPGQPPSEWEGPSGPSGPSSGGPPGASGGEEMAPAAVGAGTAAAVPAWQEPPPPEPEEGPSAVSMPPTPQFVEPSPMPSPPPVAKPVSSAGASEPAEAEAGTEEAEPDIDSLMAELEKISGEILKKTPKKTSSVPADSAEDAES